MNTIHRSHVRTATSGLFIAAMIASGLGTAAAQAPQNKMSYAEDIAPIFRGYCESCHKAGGAGTEASGLDLKSYAGLMKGTKFGPMVVPGQPDSSNLIVLLRGDAKIRMPLGHKALPNELVRNIWSWIFEGAKNN